MDAISDNYRNRDWPTKELFLEHLGAIKPHCRWNEGFWDFGGGISRKWNEIQNTSKDINLLANYLTRKYQQWIRSNSDH